ncbi:hypothetical protein TWF506_006865 [Arthrobotrys conoides]|uniref:Uncharacterized protein n=1 Tax=Arthrobotrys conoides TaxID=74498 RepID=A0AAN8NHK3_9PEZI
MDLRQESFNGDTDGFPMEPATSQSEVDSGYFSRERASRSTVEISSQDRIINIQDPVSRTSKTFSGKGFFAKSKQPELLLFRDAHIPDEFYSRFQDLVQLYDRPLKSKLKPKFMSWKVKVFGENENTKRPYIVILCDAASTKKLTKFFTKKEIKQQCEGTEGLPPMPVLVITSAPAKVSADIDIPAPEVFGREDVLLDSCSSCGESIKIVHGGKAKMATLGGIVKVTIGGEVKFYGITAGHIVHEDQADDDTNSVDISEDYDLDTESEDESSSDTDSISTTASSLEIHVPTEDGGCNFGWTKIGQVMKPIAATRELGSCNLDWGLVELADGARKKMNIIKELPDQDCISSDEYWVSNRIDTVYLRKYGNVVDMPVLYQPGTEPGYLRGTINTMPAFMSQSPSNRMARIYNMTWNSEWDQVSAGDCGSWVVDPNVGSFGRGNHSLYGHIVAVDIFDEAYVVPFEDTMEQLAKYLGAEAVELPLCEDFMDTSSISHELVGCKPIKELSGASFYGEFGHLAPQRSVSEFDSDTAFEFDWTPSGSEIELDSRPTEVFSDDWGSWTMERSPEPIQSAILTKSTVGHINNPENSSSSPSPRNYILELTQYCQKWNMHSLIYCDDEIVIANTPGLRSQSTVYIEGILYGASLWKGMHSSVIDADQLASREALRNLAKHHQRGLFEGLGDTKPKIGKPNAIVSEEIMKQYQQKQLEILLPKILKDTPEGTRPSSRKATVVSAKEIKQKGGTRERKCEFSMDQEQDIPAAVRLKEWFAAARKRHPAETIDALLNKQCDLEDEINDAKYAQESIRKEIRKAEEILLETSIEQELMATERKRLVQEVEFLKRRLDTIRLRIKQQRGYLHSATNGVSPMLEQYRTSQLRL